MKNIIWLFVCLVLLGLVLWLWQKPTGQAQSMQTWPTIAVAKIAEVRIQQATGGHIILLLKHDKWYVGNDVEAVQDAVLHLLDDLSAMQVVRVVSRSHAHDAELGFLKRTVTVRCMDAQGAILLDIEVGKQGSDLLSTYVRKAGDDAIVAVNKALLWQLRRSQKAWQQTKKAVQ